MLFEIAKIAAAQDGHKTSLYIENYGITDQNMLFEIAKIAAAQDGQGTIFKPSNYHFSKGEQLQILQICLAQIVREALESNDFSTLENFARIQAVSPQEELFEAVAQMCSVIIPSHFENTEEKQEIEEYLKEALKS